MDTLILSFDATPAGGGVLYASFGAWNATRTVASPTPLMDLDFAGDKMVGFTIADFWGAREYRVPLLEHELAAGDPIPAGTRHLVIRTAFPGAEFQIEGNPVKRVVRDLRREAENELKLIFGSCMMVRHGY